jgi:hypothetical protein
MVLSEILREHPLLVDSFFLDETYSRVFGV